MVKIYLPPELRTQQDSAEGSRRQSTNNQSNDLLAIGSRYSENFTASESARKLTGDA